MEHTQQSHDLSLSDVGRIMRSEGKFISSTLVKEKPPSDDVLR